MAGKIHNLQQWCKRQCEGYDDVNITNMTSSWKNGLAFCAIIHRYRPDIIDYASLSKENVYENNKLAFDTALRELEIPALLDAEDMVAMRVPDKLCIITYVAQYYNYFRDKEPVGGPGVKSGVKRQPGSPPPSGPTAKKSSPEKQNHMGDVCNLCNNKVFVMERHMENGQLYHRRCIRAQQRASTKTAAAQHAAAAQSTAAAAGATHAPVVAKPWGTDIGNKGTPVPNKEDNPWLKRKPATPYVPKVDVDDKPLKERAVNVTHAKTRGTNTGVKDSGITDTNSYGKQYQTRTNVLNRAVGDTKVEFPSANVSPITSPVRPATSRPHYTPHTVTGTTSTAITTTTTSVISRLLPSNTSNAARASSAATTTSAGGVATPQRVGQYSSKVGATPTDNKTSGIRATPYSRSGTASTLSGAAPTTSRSDHSVGTVTRDRPAQQANLARPVRKYDYSSAQANSSTSSKTSKPTANFNVTPNKLESPAVHNPSNADTKQTQQNSSLVASLTSRFASKDPKPVFGSAHYKAIGTSSTASSVSDSNTDQALPTPANPSSTTRLVQSPPAVSQTNQPSNSLTTTSISSNTTDTSPDKMPVGSDEKQSTTSITRRDFSPSGRMKDRQLSPTRHKSPVRHKSPSRVTTISDKPKVSAHETRKALFPWQQDYMNKSRLPPDGDVQKSPPPMEVKNGYSDRKNSGDDASGLLNNLATVVHNKESRHDADSSKPSRAVPPTIRANTKALHLRDTGDGTVPISSSSPQSPSSPVLSSDGSTPGNARVSSPTGTKSILKSSFSNSSSNSSGDESVVKRREKPCRRTTSPASGEGGAADPDPLRPINNMSAFNIWDSIELAHRHTGKADDSWTIETNARQQFSPSSTPAAANRENTESKTEWQLEAEMRRIARNGRYADPEKRGQHGGDTKHAEKPANTKQILEEHGVFFQKATTPDSPKHYSMPAGDVRHYSSPNGASSKTKLNSNTPVNTHIYSEIKSPRQSAPSNEPVSPSTPHNQNPEQPDASEHQQQQPNPLLRPGRRVIRPDTCVSFSEELRDETKARMTVPSSKSPPAASPRPDRPPPPEPTWLKTRPQPMPPTQNTPRRKVVSEPYLDTSQLLLKLEAIDLCLRDCEERGRDLEDYIRAGGEDRMDDVEVMDKWFTLVNEKNGYVRQETDYMYRIKQQELEEQHSEIEYELRCLYDMPPHHKTQSDFVREEALLKVLVDVVRQRSNIVDAIEEDRLRYIQEDREIAAIMAEKKKTTWKKSPSKKHKKKHKPFSMERKSKKNKSHKAK